MSTECHIHKIVPTAFAEDAAAVRSLAVNLAKRSTRNAEIVSEITHDIIERDPRAPLFVFDGIEEPENVRLLAVHWMTEP